MKDAVNGVWKERFPLLCQQASCIDDHLQQPISPLSYLKSLKEQQKVWIMKREVQKRRGQPQRRAGIKAGLFVCTQNPMFTRSKQSSSWAKLCA